MAYLEYFAPARIALQQELRYHPDLIEKLQGQPVDEFEMRLAEIAAHCGVILDGEYLPADLDKLCDILVQRLKEMRGAIATYTSEDVTKLN